MIKESIVRAITKGKDNGIDLDNDLDSEFFCNHLCDDCQQDKDNCPDCFQGDLYRSPDDYYDPYDD